MRKHAFELRIIPREEGDYRLELWEPPAPDSRPTAKRRAGRALSSVQGWYLELAEGHVRRTLEKNGYKASDLKRTRRTPFKLNEEDGVRLDLSFRAIQGLRQRTRIDDILHGLREMSREEMLYWHAKTTRDNGTLAENGIVAFRILLGGNTR